MLTSSARPIFAGVILSLGCTAVTAPTAGRPTTFEIVGPGGAFESPRRLSTPTSAAPSSSHVLQARRGVVASYIVGLVACYALLDRLDHWHEVSYSRAGLRRGVDPLGPARGREWKPGATRPRVLREGTGAVTLRLRSERLLLGRGGAPNSSTYR